MKTKKSSKKQDHPKLRQIVNAIQFYDLRNCGFPLAEYRGQGAFQSISKGDTVDGSCWPRINGHAEYAKVYRVVSIRHTIHEKPTGTVKHLKSVFVEPII